VNSINEKSQAYQGSYNADLATTWTVVVCDELLVYSKRYSGQQIAKRDIFYEPTTKENEANMNHITIKH
jgi:hypothetical protein